MFELTDEASIFVFWGQSESFQLICGHRPQSSNTE